MTGSRPATGRWAVRLTVRYAGLRGGRRERMVVS
ncbi:hypothetical protein RKD41_006323 [Streptomyces tendae]